MITVTRLWRYLEHSGEMIYHDKQDVVLIDAIIH